MDSRLSVAQADGACYQCENAKREARLLLTRQVGE